MSTNIVPILVPTRELSDSFVVGMLRLFHSTNNNFAGDLLARHAPKSTEYYLRSIAAQVPMLREQRRIEQYYMQEMLLFTKGLMQALMDESIGMSTAWGRTQPHLSESVNVFMERNSHNWHNDGAGSREQREFYDEVMDPFLMRVNNYWDVKIRSHPNLVWFGQFTPHGDLLIEAGDDYRSADPECLVKRVEAPMFLDNAFGEANGECNDSYLRFRRNIAGIERELNVTPAEDPRVRARQIETLGKLLAQRTAATLAAIGAVKIKPMDMPEKPSQTESFRRLVEARTNPHINIHDGIQLVRMAKDDIVDDAGERPDPTKSSVPEVPVTQAEVIARNPLAIIRAQNMLTELEAERRLKLEHPEVNPLSGLEPIVTMVGGRDSRKMYGDRRKKTNTNKPEN